MNAHRLPRKRAPADVDLTLKSTRVDSVACKGLCGAGVCRNVDRARISKLSAAGGNFVRFRSSGKPFVLPTSADGEGTSPLSREPAELPGAQESYGSKVDELCSGVQGTVLKEETWEDEGKFESTEACFCCKL